MLFGFSIFLVSMLLSSTGSAELTPPQPIAPNEISANIGELSQKYFVSEQKDGSKVHWAFLEYSFSEFDRGLRNFWDRPADQRISAIAILQNGDQPIQTFVFNGNRYQDEIQLRISTLEIFNQIKQKPKEPKLPFSRIIRMKSDLPVSIFADDFVGVFFEEGASLREVSEKDSAYRWKPKNQNVGVMLTGGQWMDAIFESFELASVQRKDGFLSPEAGFLTISYVAKRDALKAKPHSKMSLQDFNRAMMNLQKLSPTLIAKEIYEWDAVRFANFKDGKDLFKGLSGKELVELAAYYYAGLDSLADIEALFAAWNTTVSMTCAQPKTLHTPVTTKDGSDYFGYQWGYTDTNAEGEKNYVTSFHYSFAWKNSEIQMVKGTRGWPDLVLTKTLQK